MNQLFRIEDSILSREEAIEIDRLFLKCENNPPTLKDIWRLMDEVWDNLGCDNRILDFYKISAFYRHPVWMFNGLFVEQDKISLYNRRIISDWIILNKDKISSVLDYGGGFGTLARMIAKRDKHMKIDVYEPHPTKIAIYRTKEYNNISFVDKITKRYDCIVSTDVLEHCYDPLNILYEMIKILHTNGYLIIANNFSPCIKCHLPSTFHLRYTFNLFAKMMGLNYVGHCLKNYAKIFEKEFESNINFKKLVKLEILSKKIYPLINMTHFCLQIIRKKFR